ncbi:hypothetical protein MCOR02_006921 [Pyricularia oryzae]|nr:hypothetical protein MCOR02_006921 [Pyricularia oryzae]KAI6394072.1 hypothetical protein MCOR23_007686 [Pyricularia oryzae]
MQDPSVAQKNKIADVARSMQGCFETIEATIKIAKVYTGRFEIVAFSESYHDLAQGSGSATYSTGRRNGGPSMSGQPAFPAPTRTGPCSAGRTGHRQNVDSLTGFIMESILSTGGIVPPKGYLKRMAEDCRKRGRAPGPELGQAVSERALKLGLSCNVVNWPGMGGVFRLAPLITVTEDD